MSGDATVQRVEPARRTKSAQRARVEGAGAAEPAPVRLALLGSTGSIGRQTLDVVAALPGRFEVVALAAGRDAATFAAQVSRFRPRAVALADEAALASIERPSGSVAERGPQALERIAVRDDVDVVVVATSGIVALPPVLRALAAGKAVAIANKETLVAGGHLVLPLAREAAARGVRASGGPPAAWPQREAHPRPYVQADPLAWLRPIDSEHSALWQCLLGEPREGVARIWLTASGGPFRAATAEEIAAVTPAQALRHPTWRMGAKVTVDSATLMNKGLEVIEAHWLYDVPYERISIAIHPQSVVHSAVEFVDGSLKAQLGPPDMRIPIQYALTYPARVPSPAQYLSLPAIGRLDFEPPDERRFPALSIARAAALAGPRATAALIASDEVAVRRFLEGTLDFPGIGRLVGAAVERFAGTPGAAAPDLAEVTALDAEVRVYCERAEAESSGGARGGRAGGGR